MLHPNTKQLVTHLESIYPSYTIVSNYIYTIRKLGTREDVSVLMDYYYKHPRVYHVNYILSLLYNWGTLSDAKKLWEFSFENGRLKDNYSEEILHLLGYLGFQESRDTLLHYALNSENHSLNQNAVLGLLHLDCSDCEEALMGEIERCYGKSLFAEFSPALVCKVPNQYDILSHFYKLGSSIVSTDCNGGILLAFSLCGEVGEGFFWKVIWDENWECLGGGTGTDYWTYIAMRNLKITFLELYQQLKKTTNTELLEYQLNVFRSLLRYALIDAPHPIRFIKPSPFSFLNLYQTLYSWKDANTSNNITDLARKVNLESVFYELENLLEYKMREEMLCI